MSGEQAGGLPLTDVIDRRGLTAFLERALAYPSPQTDQLESDPRMATFIRDVIVPEVRTLAPDALHVDAMGNVLAQWGQGTAALAVAVYAMTHPAASMPEPFVPTMVDGAPYGVPGPCIRGRGACEQKGAMAAALAGFRAALGRTRPRRALALIALTSGETGRPDAVHHLLTETGAVFEMALVACGTDNRVCLAQKGRLDVDIVVHGKQSHSGMPWLGVNALEGAAIVLGRLAAHKVVGEHPELGRITLTPTGLSTEPRATHTVPALARITVDRRLRPGEAPEVALAELQGFVGSVPSFEIAYEVGPFMYQYELAPDDRLPQLLRDAFVRELGREPQYAHLSGGLDAGYFQHRGITSLMFGPGDTTLAHTVNDVVGVEACMDAARVYATVLRAAAEASV
jgi:acetylornithine deacetylase/succinyl-diaminopimelate desuccinylase-like protein